MNKRKRVFTFYGGHDPEDFQHGRSSYGLGSASKFSGYRLILNNVLFPAARKKQRLNGCDVSFLAFKNSNLLVFFY
jgi:hypothetical protein